MNYLDYFGYFASLVILISLLASSIKKLRWINLFGAILFTIYAILIKSIPTAFMNFAIALIDIYFLVKIYTSKSYFSILELKEETDYFNSLLKYHKDDLIKFFGTDKFSIDSSKFAFYILKDMSPIGIFIGKRDGKSLEVELDFVTLQYRDFKIGKYLYTDNKEMFKKEGFELIKCVTDNDLHKKYLDNMGFKYNGKEYIYEL